MGNQQIRAKVIASLHRRIKQEITDGRNHIAFLRDVDFEKHIDPVILALYMYTRPKEGWPPQPILFIEVISALGKALRNSIRAPRDTGKAVRAGAFLLYTFEEVGLLQMKLSKSAKKHATYVVEVLDDEGICALWDTACAGSSEKMPKFEPYEPWTSAVHPRGFSMVKTEDPEVLAKLTPESHPLVFETLNRAQKTGWQINPFIYDLHKWALRNKTEAFNNIWSSTNKQAKATKHREAKIISSMAARLIGKTFYHLYTYDFRGRKYVSTAYLHEQGSDLARGLLLRADQKPIGEAGLKWLLISIANNWAGESGRRGLKTDKLPLDERVHWALDNEFLFHKYAEEPRINTGWMSADKPWQFLAACHELFRLRKWQKKHKNCDMPSGLEIFIDGSNNGSQHLSALSRDEVTAPHVNLVSQAIPGDLYKYVGDHVWEALDARLKKISLETQAEARLYVDDIIDVKKQLADATPQSERYKSLVEKLQALRASAKSLGDAPAIVFWKSIVDPKHRRKIVKRNCMTLPYGGTPYGLGNQQFEDAKKHGIERVLHVEQVWAAYMGRLVFTDCRTSLERPMQLLAAFEGAGKKADADNRFLKWTVPITGFPVVQHYVTGEVKKLWVQYGPQRGERKKTGHFDNTLQLSVSHAELPIPAKGKQAQGASPNMIHSLDAAHLMMIVHACDFPVTTIHDSFGCLAADMPTLFRVSRETFVELYRTNPLPNLAEQIGADLSKVDFGNLDITSVLEAEYSFC